MKNLLFVALLVLCAVPLAAQAPATPDAAPAMAPIPPPPPPSDAASAPISQPSTPAAQSHASDLGFSYSLPQDWEIMDTPPMLPAMLQKAAREYGNETAKMAACVQLPLTAHHGNPASAIAVVGLSFDCVGHSYTTADIPSVASNVTDSMKKNVEIDNPVDNTYTLGTHGMWIERASGSLAGHPEIKRTMETVCSVLKKGVVCWMTLAADDAALQTFEQGMVTLDGEDATALVPADALQKKP
jgi:hypothetical protein